MRHFSDMSGLIGACVTALRAVGMADVYPGFDGVPSDRKRRRITVVSPEECTMQAALPGAAEDVLPFAMQVRITVLAPMTDDGMTLEDHFYRRICPAMLESGLACTAVRIGAPTAEPKLGRMSCSGVFGFAGYCRTETEECS